MALDLSGISFFMPIFSFLLVFIIVYSVLFATRILGESKWVHLIISFIIAVIFISVSSFNLYVQEIVPWIAVLLVIVFLIMLILMFQGSKWIIGSKWVGGILIGVMIIIFVLAAIKVFNPVFHPYLPGSEMTGENTFLVEAKNFIYSGKFLGSVLLLVIAFIVGKVLTKK